MTMGVAGTGWGNRLLLLLLLLLRTAASITQCELVDERETNDLVSVSFEFWYAVGTQEPNVIDNATALFDLEQLIHTSIDAESLWCTIVAQDTTTTTGVRRRRQQESVHRLGVVTYTPGRPDQVVVDGTCQWATLC